MLTWDFQEKKAARSAKGAQGSRSFTRVYQLIATGDRATEAEAYKYVTDPDPDGQALNVGAAHPDAAGAGTVITSIDVADEADDGRQWAVTVEWGVPRTGSLSPDPLLRPVVVEWSTEVETEEFIKDHSGTPKFVRNSAGEAFDPKPTREKTHVVISYQRNDTPAFFKTVVLPLMAYNFVVNSGSFVIDGVTVPALYARLQIRRAPRVIEGATTYYAVEYELRIRAGLVGYEADGWEERYLDRGHYEIPPASPNSWRPIRDADGQIVQEPWPLDGSGAAKPNPDDSPAVLNPFKVYPEVSFTTLLFS